MRIRNSDIQKTHKFENTPQTTKIRTQRVSVLEMVSGRHFAIESLNQVLGCNNLTLALSVYHMNTHLTLTNSLGECTHIHTKYSAVLHAKARAHAHTHARTYEVDGTVMRNW